MTVWHLRLPLPHCAQQLDPAQRWVSQPHAGVYGGGLWLRRSGGAGQACSLRRTLLLGCTGCAPHTVITLVPPRPQPCLLASATSFFYRQLLTVRVAPQPLVLLPALSLGGSSMQLGAGTRPRL